MYIKSVLFVFMSLMFISETRAVLSARGSSQELELSASFKKEISKIYHQAKIDILGAARWVKGNPPSKVESIIFLEDDGKGNAHFNVNHESECWVSFSAWVSGEIALRRIRPNEKLSADLFIPQQINVAIGQAHEYRGVIYSDLAEGAAADPISSFESVQTILEGQFLTTSSMRKTPDIRKGDAVRIRVISGELILSIAGVAAESGYLKSQVRVIAGKNKHELLGLLQPSGVIEVKL